MVRELIYFLWNCVTWEVIVNFFRADSIYLLQIQKPAHKKVMLTAVSSAACIQHIHTGCKMLPWQVWLDIYSLRQKCHRCCDGICCQSFMSVICLEYHRKYDRCYLQTSPWLQFCLSEAVGGSYRASALLSAGLIWDIFQSVVWLDGQSIHPALVFIQSRWCFFFINSLSSVLCLNVVKIDPGPTFWLDFSGIGY